ncbi:MAG: hypothetical protein JHC26_01430 [Thermofilum sp.]|uniref:hypothetical protein n=1 Tax=Thermofilum sp. TaxID=1961369 RepID=UPI002583DB49|nr:hypothetical protein [Thermofilum sp.]MCI4407722.1 hypothetical protein [Thermofilum sp.]
MSVKQYDSELGEALYQYITGKLDKLPSVYRDAIASDKKRLASAILYVQKRYGLSPQEVIEKIRERKNMGNAGIASISGSTLKKLLEILGYFESNYDVEEPRLMLYGDKIHVLGISNDRVRVAITDIPRGNGYVAPRSEKLIRIKPNTLVDYRDNIQNVDKLIIRDGMVYAVKDGNEVPVGIEEQDETEKIHVEKVLNELEINDKQVEFYVKPEFFKLMRQIGKNHIDLYIAKENGNPALYIGYQDEGSEGSDGYLYRVPDYLIEKVSIDPSIPDGDFAYFKGIVTRDRWPTPTEKALVRTRIHPDLYPMKITTKLGDGQIYNIYYAPSTPHKEKFKPFYPVARYQILDKAVPYILVDAISKNTSLYIMPSKDKVIIVGKPSGIDALPYVAEIKATSKIKEGASLPEVLTISKRLLKNYGIYRPMDFIPMAFDVAKTLRDTPYIDIGNEGISFSGVTVGLEKTPEDEATKLKDAVSMYHSISPSESTVIELSGEDLLDIINSINEFRRKEWLYDDPYTIELRVTPNGDAELQVRGKKTVWTKTLKATNPPDKELRYVDTLDSLTHEKGFPIISVEKGAGKKTLPAELLRKTKIEIMIPKKAPSTLKATPIILRTQVGNTTIYAGLTLHENA